MLRRFTNLFSRSNQNTPPIDNAKPVITIPKNLEKKSDTQETEKIKQDSVINDVKTEIAKKKEEDIQKENQGLIDEQEKQSEKDRVNGVITEK